MEASTKWIRCRTRRPYAPTRTCRQRLDRARRHALGPGRIRRLRVKSIRVGLHRGKAKPAPTAVLTGTRVTQPEATATAARTRTISCSRPPTSRRGGSLAVGADPDRDRRARGDLGRRRPRAAAPPAARPAAPLAERASRVSDRQGGRGARTAPSQAGWRLALTALVLAAPAAGAVPAQFWGVGPAVAAGRSPVPAAQARRRRQAALPDRMERGRKRRRESRLGLRRLVGRRRERRAGSNCCRLSTGAPEWAMQVRSPSTSPRTASRRAISR